MDQTFIEDFEVNLGQKLSPHQVNVCIVVARERRTLREPRAAPHAEMPNVFKRHDRQATATRAAVEAWGTADGQNSTVVQDRDGSRLDGWGSTTKSRARSGASSRREQSPLPTLAGFEFIAEDVASHDGSLSTLR